MTKSQRDKHSDPITEEEVTKVLESFSAEERAAVQLMRRQLTARGITREPMRTRMACEFAEVLLMNRTLSR